jgi:hypothetical protein
MFILYSFKVVQLAQVVSDGRMTAQSKLVHVVDSSIRGFHHGNFVDGVSEQWHSDQN